MLNQHHPNKDVLDLVNRLCTWNMFFLQPYQPL